jgi:peptide methionine sulfoxide reductase MsrB
MVIKPKLSDWTDPIAAIPGAVNRHEDKSMFMTRTEITCANWQVFS